MIHFHAELSMALSEQFIIILNNVKARRWIDNTVIIIEHIMIQNGQGTLTECS